MGQPVLELPLEWEWHSVRPNSVNCSDSFPLSLRTESGFGEAQVRNIQANRRVIVILPLRVTTANRLRLNSQRSLGGCSHEVAKSHSGSAVSTFVCGPTNCRSNVQFSAEGGLAALPDPLPEELELLAQLAREHTNRIPAKMQKIPTETNSHATNEHLGIHGSL